LSETTATSREHDTPVHGPGHVVSLRLLFTVLGALLFLTFVTVAITWVDLGGLNVAAAMAIALVKASLVGLYFMHLRWDRPFNAIVMLLSLCLVALFIVLTLLDSTQYTPDLIPGYAPDMER
jgi:cytochrome c oxidase subunit 4